VPVLVEAAGIVMSDPKPNPADPDRCTFVLRLETLRAVPGPEPSPPPPVRQARVMVRWEGVAPRYGDRVRVVASARPPRGARNPAQFDAAAWLARRDIRTELLVREPGDAAVLERRVGNPMMHAARDVRDWMLGRLALGLEDHPEIRGTIAGIVLGITSETPEELTEEFRRTGTLHLFAVSGLHVGMFAFLAWMVVHALPLPRPARLLLIFPILAFYAAITGLAPSVVRATVMAFIVLGGRMVERPSRMLNNLALAGFVLLLWDSHDLFDAGFQLSFGVVLTIVLIAGPIARCLRPLCEPDSFIPVPLRSPLQRGGARAGLWFAGAAATSLAAWIGSTPLGIRYFHLVSPVAVLTNLVVIPISFAVLALGLLAVAGGLVSPMLAIFFNKINAVASGALLGCIHLFSLVPLGWFHVRAPDPPGEAARMTVLDLGQAQCVVVEAGGSAWVADPGGARDYALVTRPFLRSRGLDRIDGLVLTHGDARHIGAAGECFEDFRPRTIAVPAVHDRSGSRRAFEQRLAERGIGRALWYAGHRGAAHPRPRGRCSIRRRASTEGLRTTRAS
jgi:competence protein ComEC